jgi:anti-sigma factor RsiW
MACPEHEDLVKFLHGELSEDEAGIIEKHLAKCLRCSVLAIDLSMAGGALQSAGRGARARGCPPRDVLETYLAGTIDERRRAKLDKHISVCDACLAELATLHEEKLQKSTRAGLSAGAIQKLYDMKPEGGGAAAPRSGGIAARWRAVKPIYRIAAASAAVLVIVVVLFLVLGNPSADETTAQLTEPAGAREDARAAAYDDPYRKGKRIEIGCPDDETEDGEELGNNNWESAYLKKHTHSKTAPSTDGTADRSDDYADESGYDFNKPESQREEPKAPAPLPEPPVVEAPAPTPAKSAPPPPPPSKPATAVKVEPKPPQPLACLSLFEGMEVKEPGGSAWKGLDEKTKLAVKTELRTTRKEGRVFFGEDLSILFAKKTRVAVVNDGGTASIKLLGGEIVVEAYERKEPALFSLAGATVKLTDCTVHMQGGKSPSVTAIDGGCGVVLCGDAVTVATGHKLMLGKSDKLGRPRKTSSGTAPKWTRSVHLAHKVVHGAVSIKSNGYVLINYRFKKDDEIEDFITRGTLWTKNRRLGIGLHGSASAVVSKLLFAGEYQLEYTVEVENAGTIHTWAIGTKTGSPTDAFSGGAITCPPNLRRLRTNRVWAARLLIRGEVVNTRNRYLRAGRTSKISVKRKGNTLTWQHDGKSIFTEKAGDPGGDVNFALAFTGQGSAYVSRLSIYCKLDRKWLKDAALGKDDAKKRLPVGKLGAQDGEPGKRKGVEKGKSGEIKPRKRWKRRKKPNK